MEIRQQEGPFEGEEVNEWTSPYLEYCFWEITVPRWRAEASARSEGASAPERRATPQPRQE